MRAPHRPPPSRPDMTAEREAELVERLADCGLAAEAADLAPGASTAAAKVRPKIHPPQALQCAAATREPIRQGQRRALGRGGRAWPRGGRKRRAQP